MGIKVWGLSFRVEGLGGSLGSSLDPVRLLAGVMELVIGLIAKSKQSSTVVESCQPAVSEEAQAASGSRELACPCYHPSAFQRSPLYGSTVCKCSSILQTNDSAPTWAGVQEKTLNPKP